MFGLDLRIRFELSILAFEAVTGGVKEKDGEDEFTVYARILALFDKQNVDKLGDLVCWFGLNPPFCLARDFLLSLWFCFLITFSP